MSNTGRNRVLDAKKKNQITAILGVGCTRRTAAAFVGCAPSTIAAEMQRDPEFANELRDAEQQQELHHLQTINEARKKPQYWRASAWWLEKRLPHLYDSKGAGIYTKKQVFEILRQLAEIIMEEVPATKHRKAIIKRFEKLLEQDRSETEND